jgi:hypothetical protein
MTRKASTLLLTVLVAAAGCSLSTDLPPLKPISIVTVRSLADASSPSGFVAKAFGYFFSERGFNYADSRSPSDACAGPQAVNIAGSGPSQWLSPGQPTQFTLRGPNAAARTVQLLNGQQDDPNVYTNSTAPTLYPGSDSSTITVPGEAGGFPAIEVSAKTVQDFTFDPVADSGTASGLAIHWSPSTNSNTAMEIDLVYKSDPTSTVLDAQIVCTAVDDGDFSVPKTFLFGWERAGDDSSPLDHEVRFTRFLTATAGTGDATILLLNTLDKTLIK